MTATNRRILVKQSLLWGLLPSANPSAAEALDLDSEAAAEAKRFLAGHAPLPFYSDAKFQLPFEFPGKGGIMGLIMLPLVLPEIIVAVSLLSVDGAGESFSRFERYFGYPPKGDRVKECHEKKLQWDWPLKHRHEVVEEGTALWDLILSNNQWDMELYEYAEFIFQEQARIFQ